MEQLEFIRRTSIAARRSIILFAFFLDMAGSSLFKVFTLVERVEIWEPEFQLLDERILLMARLKIHWRDKSKEITNAHKFIPRVIV